MYWNYILPYENQDRRRLNNSTYITGCSRAGNDVVDYRLFRLSLANFQGLFRLAFQPPNHLETLQKFNRTECTIVHLLTPLVLEEQYY